MSGSGPAGGEEGRGARSAPVAPAPVPVDVGIVMALGLEAGFLIDRLTKVRKYAGPRLAVVEGECAGKLVALTIAGMGREAARRAARLLLDGHRPRWVLSAGFGGALNPALARYEIVLPGEVIDLEGQHFTTDVGEAPEGQSPRYATGRLLTVDQIIRTAAEKAELHRRFAADLVDMETSGVAEVCRDRAVKFLPIRVISDEAQADLPPEVVALLTRSGSYRLGAALRAVWRRPSSVKDLWALHEHAQEAADRLAKFVVATLPRLG